MTVLPRIYADFNSVCGEGGTICWCLRYGLPLRDLDEFTEELGLRDGMPVMRPDSCWSLRWVTIPRTVVNGSKLRLND